MEPDKGSTYSLAVIFKKTIYLSPIRKGNYCEFPINFDSSTYIFRLFITSSNFLQCRIINYSWINIVRGLNNIYPFFFLIIWQKSVEMFAITSWNTLYTIFSWFSTTFRKIPFYFPFAQIYPLDSSSNFFVFFTSEFAN